MASGDTLLILPAWAGVPPTTTYATFGTIIGADAYPEVFQVALFDDSLDEAMDFLCVMPENYSGGGLTCTIIFAHSSISTGPTWGMGLRRINDDAEDLDSTNHAYAYNTVAAGAPSILGEVGYDNITFTDGSDMDSVVAGELFLLRIYRDGLSDGTGDAKLLAIHVKET